MNDLLPFVVIGLTAGSVYGLAGTGLVLTYKTSGVFNFALRRDRRGRGVRLLLALARQGMRLAASLPCSASSCSGR